MSASKAVSVMWWRAAVQASASSVRRQKPRWCSGPGRLRTQVYSICLVRQSVLT